MKKDTDAIREKLLGKSGKQEPVKKGLSTGSTLLNLACSGDPHYGWIPGNFFFLVGDSSSGKSFLTMTAMAEAGINPDYRDYRFIHDNAENGALMDIARYFGPAVARRLEPPAGTTRRPEYSATVEDFYYNIDNAFKQGKPFIYILDSMDALTTEEEEEKFAKDKTASAKGKETGGSYGTSKAKKNSSLLRVVYNRLRKEGKSIIMVISQTRENIGFGAQFNPKTRSGGKALTFYAALELWSSVTGHVKKTVKGKEVEQGIYCQVRVKKNRLTGRDRTVEFPILHAIGIDDLGGCVNFLVDWKHWKSGKEGDEEKKGPGKKKAGKITAPEFDFAGPAEVLIDKIMDEGRENELREIVARVWHEIEKEAEPKRERRYG